MGVAFVRGDPFKKGYPPHPPLLNFELGFDWLVTPIKTQPKVWERGLGKNPDSNWDFPQESHPPEESAFILTGWLVPGRFSVAFQPLNFGVYHGSW